MQHTSSLAERPIGAVIDAIASDDVVPGAGSAAALGLALAAACAGKAVAVTLKHRPDDTMLTRARETLAHIARRALHGADEDAAHFREFMHEKDAPSSQELLDAGKRLQQLGAELLGVLDLLAECVEPAVRGDIRAAMVLCTAFGQIQSENLAENREAAARIGGD